MWEEFGVMLQKELARNLLGAKDFLMAIPLKNTIQIKSYGKVAAIAALKSRKKRSLWRNLKTPTSSKETVLFGVE